jgi:DNA-binding NarL/FixJ family response regulator
MDQVLLVEDDTATRQWLGTLLGACEGVQVAHACGSVSEALAWLDHHAADVVLTDLGLPDGSGLEVIRAAVRQPGCEVLVLSIFGDESNVIAALDAGASGYLLKDDTLESLRDHVACLKSGGSPLSPRIARTLIRRTRTPSPPAAASRSDSGAEGGSAPTAAGPTLSERELEVLTGIGKGFSYAEVAQALGITANTVRTHVRHIYDKLSVNSRIEALYEYNRRQSEQGRPGLA